MVDFEKTLFWIGHASFYVKHNGKTIYIDPFGLSSKINQKADLVLITHAHQDHWQPDEIRRIATPETEIICPGGCNNEGDFKNFRVIEPGFAEEFRGIKISTIPAYNIKSERLNFHPKSNKWVGYILDVDGFRIYHAGDTDFIEEMKGLKNIGASLLPIGGHYVMTVEEAMEAAKAINARYAVPMHYKALLGRDGSAAAEKKWKSMGNAMIMKEVQEPKYSF